MTPPASFAAPSPSEAAARATSAPRTPALRTALIDAHVHYYPHFGWDRFLDAAASHLLRANSTHDLAVLLFAERAEDDELLRLRNGAADIPPHHWRIEPTPEPGTLSARCGDARLLLITGRQIRTAEGLELLALCTDKRFPDAVPLARAYRIAIDAGALPVIPWGVGKWWFQRAKVIQRLLHDPKLPPGFLGDSSARPSNTPTPRLFRAATAAGWRILPGTDPLPLKSDAILAGSYGFALDGPVDPAAPAASLRALLSDPATTPRPFGRPRTLTAALRSQLALRLARRTSARTRA